MMQSSPPGAGLVVEVPASRGLYKLCCLYRKKKPRLEPSVALKGDSVTFDMSEMGPSFIRHGAADLESLWVVCETAHIPPGLPRPPALSLNFASNRGKCPRILLSGETSSMSWAFWGLALEL